MRSISPVVARAIFGVAIAVALGCERGSSPAAEAGVEGDTAAGDGLSSEELQNQARPLSPEEAKELGIIDSVTQGAQPAPTGPSSVVPGAPPAPVIDSVP